VKKNGAAVRGTAEPGEEAATENQTKRGGRRLLLKKKKIKFFRVRFVSSFFLSRLPPSQNQYSMVFIEKILLGFQTSPSTFPFFSFPLFFFVNFDFFDFLYF
jgi:hypothetical protein